MWLLTDLHHRPVVDQRTAGSVAIVHPEAMGDVNDELVGVRCRFYSYRQWLTLLCSSVAPGVQIRRRHGGRMPA